MSGMNPNLIRWCLIGALCLLYVLISIRIARRVGQTPRGRAAWFVLTLLLTAIPASLVLLRRQRAEADKKRQHVEPGRRLRRCVHCGGLLPEEGSTRADGPALGTCPHCGMKTDSTTHMA